jgi:hypothetical protein
LSAYDNFFLSFFNRHSNFVNNLNDIISYSWILYAKTTILLLTTPSLLSITNSFNFTYVFNSLANSLYITFFNMHSNLLSLSFISSSNYKLNAWSESSIEKGSLYNTTDKNFNQDLTYLSLFSETSNSQRFVRYSNTLINYDYKTGNYVGIWDKLYPYLINSFIEVTRGIKKSSWFFSEQYIELLKKNYDKLSINFTGKSNLKLSNIEDWYFSHVTPLDSLINIYYIFQKNNDISNSRWASFITLNQKYYKLFLSSSTQQRILGNW